MRVPTVMNTRFTQRLLGAVIGLSALGGSVVALGAAASTSTPSPSAPLPPSVPGALQHSGGPYVSQSSVQNAAAATLGCSIGTAQAGFPGTHCDSVSIQFFDRYDQAMAVTNGTWPPDSALSPDREVYLVTIHGSMQFTPRAPISSPVAIDHWNLVVDAATGDIISSGTAGTPLG